MLLLGRFSRFVFGRFQGSIFPRLTAASLFVSLLASCSSLPSPTQIPSEIPLQQIAATLLPSPTVEAATATPGLTITPTVSETHIADQPVELVAGAGHTCLFANDQVQCWGAGQFGQIGEVVDGIFSLSGKPVTVKGLPGDILSIASGMYHTCVRTAYEILCWGQTEYGQLGERLSSETYTSEPYPVKELPQGSLALEAYGNHSCVITDEGGVICWGNNKPKPAVVQGFAGKVKSLSIGYEFGCALLDDGKIQCWGANSSEGPGYDLYANNPNPVDVEGLSSPVVSIEAGGYHVCVIIEGGEVWCWATGGDPETRKLAKIEGLAGPAKALAAGDGHTCALLEDSTVQCWGDNYFGQVGLPLDQGGTGMPSNGKPVQIEGIQDAKSITAGTNHTCVLLEDGTIKCWGDQSSGQFGDGSVRWK